MAFGKPLRLAAAIIASTVAGCVAVSVVLAPTPVTLGTGTPGGIYHPVGNAICRMFNLARDYQSRPCVAVSSDGSVANIQGIESGKSTFGLSQTDVAYAAFHGEGPFAAAGPDPKLRLLIALYPEAFTVVARAETGIRDFKDLRGKRVGIGKSGAGYTFTRDVVLGFYGWTVLDPEHVLELDSAEQNQALCDNKVDAIIFEAGHPNGLTQEATTGCRARLVRVAGPQIDRLLAAHAYYTASVIPGGIYPGNPNDVPTIGTQAVLVISSNQPDELAYAVVKAVFENFADFRRLHPALSTLAIKDMVPSEAVMPIHPGALRYFHEAGLVHWGSSDAATRASVRVGSNTSN
jgi:TRAP transporter TAXI family solute receptor